MKLSYLIVLYAAFVSCSSDAACDHWTQVNLDELSYEKFSYKDIGFFYVNKNGDPQVSHKCRVLTSDDKILQAIVASNGVISASDYILELCELDNSEVVSIRPKYLEGFFERKHGVCVPIHNPKNLPTLGAHKVGEQGAWRVERTSS